MNVQRPTSNAQRPKHRLQAGRGTTVRELHGMQSVSAKARAAKWRHPWQVTPRWSDTAAMWVATIEPGFVGGRCPVWRTTLRNAQADGRDFGTNPLTGKPYFSDPVFAQAETEAVEERLVDIPLYLDPPVSLATWRAVGVDGETGVPQFFRDRGAAEPEEVTAEAIERGDTSALEPAPSGTRLLRACDVWVRQPRVAITSDVDIVGDLALGTALVRQTLGLRGAAPGDVLRILTGRLTPFAPTDPVAGQYEEPTWDDILIATVWLLSPPDAAPGSEPDGAWTPFVQPRLYWNLQYARPWFRAYGGDPTVPFLPPLAGGAAQIVVNSVIASLNDATQRAFNVLSTNTMAGTFYTATGGGHTAANASTDEAPARVSNGLDRAARNQAQAAARRRARRRERLDLDFPFRAEPFRPELLTHQT